MIFLNCLNRLKFPIRLTIPNSSTQVGLPVQLVVQHAQGVPLARLPIRLIYIARPLPRPPPHAANNHILPTPVLCLRVLFVPFFVLPRTVVVVFVKVVAFEIEAAVLAESASLGLNNIVVVNLLEADNSCEDKD